MERKKTNHLHWACTNPWKKNPNKNITRQTLYLVRSGLKIPKNVENVKK